jgi:hypothetical protein
MAIALARHAPGSRVCLAASVDDKAPRLGETVPPPIQPFLQHLGLWRRFPRDGHDPAYRSLTAWGAPVLAGNEFMLYVHQTGWRLDRRRFDRMMRDAAADVARVVPAAITGAEYDVRGWSLLAGNDELRARILVDATGRAARVSRWRGVRITDSDRLIGCFVTVPESNAAMRNTDRSGAGRMVVLHQVAGPTPRARLHDRCGHCSAPASWERRRLVGRARSHEFRASALERRTIDRRATDCRRRIASVP